MTGSAELSRRLHDAIAETLDQRKDVDWTFSTRYSEVDGQTVGWGFDVTRVKARPIALWFDDGAGTVTLHVPPSFLRRRGLSMTWSNLSDEQAVVSAVLDALNDRLAGT